MKRRWEIGIGMFGLIFAAIALFLWFPNDIQGDFMETTRLGRVEPGDAFFPILLTAFIGLMSLIQCVSSFLAPHEEVKPDAYPHITLRNLLFMALLFTTLLGSLAITFTLGPLVVWLTQDGITYRQLIDTPPFKYLGFIGGGFVLCFSLMTFSEGRMRLRSALVSVALIFLLILVFDIFLSNIQLPPNADF